MPKSVVLFLLLTHVAFSQSDEGTKAPPAAKSKPAKTSPVAPQSAPRVVPQGAPVLANHAQPATPPSQAISIPQPFVMKSEGGPESSLWTQYGPFAAILGSLLTVWLTQWNSRKLLSEQHKNSMILLEEQKQREADIWRAQRLWEQKRDIYMDLLKSLSTLEYDSVVLKNVELHANGELPDWIEDRLSETRRKHSDSFTDAAIKFRTHSAAGRLLLSKDAADSTDAFYNELIADTDAEPIVNLYDGYVSAAAECRAKLITHAKIELAISTQGRE